MERKKEELETINVWELMSGLDDGDDHNDISKGSASELMFSSATKPLSSSFTLQPRHDDGDAIQQLASSKVAGRHPRRSMVYSPEESIIDVSTCSDVPIKGSSIDRSNLSSSIFLGDESSSSSLENLVDDLQRSLSFRCSANKVDGKGKRGQEDDVFSQQRKASTKSLSSEATSRSALTESEVVSLPSSPLNLKKWFQANYRVLKQKNSWKAGFKSFFHEHHSKKPPTADGDVPTDLRNVDSFELNDHVAHLSSLINQGEATQSEASGRNWHSFSNSNRNKQFMEERNVLPVNRPSSWELENVIKDPAVKLVLFTTSSQSDIDAYEDSNSVRAILISLVGSSFDEKSISQHPDYERELKAALNMPVALVPTLCVRGKYIAGIDNIMQLYKKGILGSLFLEVFPHGLKPDAPCPCRGGKFLICPVCKGKCKFSRRGQESSTCRHCSGTGLIKCPGCLKS